MVRTRWVRPPQGSAQALLHPYSRGMYVRGYQYVRHTHSNGGLRGVLGAGTPRVVQADPTPAVDHLGGTAPGHRWRTCRFPQGSGALPTPSLNHDSAKIWGVRHWSPEHFFSISNHRIIKSADGCFPNVFRLRPDFEQILETATRTVALLGRR